MNDPESRELVANLLDWSAAHVSFDGAVSGVPVEQREEKVDGFPHTLWELVEHIRLAQADILAFCVEPEYHEPAWPEEYWPASPQPPEPDAWDRAVRNIQRDRERLQALARDPSVDLNAQIPHGTGQTYLRELVLVADHTSYHVGQIVAVRRMLGIWGSD